MVRKEWKSQDVRPNLFFISTYNPSLDIALKLKSPTTALKIQYVFLKSASSCCSSVNL